jgi:hypothetical protein
MSEVTTEELAQEIGRLETASRSDLLWDRDNCVAEGSLRMSANTTPSLANVPIASRPERRKRQGFHDGVIN